MGKKKTKKTDEEIEQQTGISRLIHEHRNEICNELPTGKLRIKGHPNKDKMLYVDDAGREWRRNPDIFSSYHQPMSMPAAIFHSIVDATIFCVDFPVPNMKFISINDDQTYSEVICNRYTGELIVDPKYFGTSNFCTDAPKGMITGSLTTKEHVLYDVKTHEKYGSDYKHIARGIPVGYYDGDIPHPVILHEPLVGRKAKYMSKENDPKHPKYKTNSNHNTNNINTPTNNNYSAPPSSAGSLDSLSMASLDIEASHNNGKWILMRDASFSSTSSAGKGRRTLRESVRVSVHALGLPVDNTNSTTNDTDTSEVSCSCCCPSSRRRGRKSIAPVASESNFEGGNEKGSKKKNYPGTPTTIHDFVEGEDEDEDVFQHPNDTDTMPPEIFDDDSDDDLPPPPPELQLPPPIDTSTIWSGFGSDGKVTDKTQVSLIPNEGAKFDLPQGWGGKPAGKEGEINDENRVPSSAEGGPKPRSAPNTNAHADYIGGTRKDQEISEGVMDRIKGLEDQGLQTKKRMGRKMLTPRIITDVKETWDNDGNIKREMKHYIEDVDGTKRIEKETAFIPAAAASNPMEEYDENLVQALAQSGHLEGLNQPKNHDDLDNTESLEFNDLFDPPKENAFLQKIIASKKAANQE